MCGEIDEQAAVGQELIERFQALARQMQLDQPAPAPPPDLSRQDSRTAYMESVFRDGLARALTGVAAADDDAAVDALALRAIALARLAGFLAGQLPPEADLFRALIEAVTAGHAEPREMTEAMPRHHHHHHEPQHP
jgi:hypothetical protein